MNEYAHKCCNQHPAYGTFQDTYQGVPQMSHGFHCKICGSGVGTIGGGLLYALKHWNIKHPQPEILACEMFFVMPVMGKTYDGVMSSVALSQNGIIHPVTGEQIEVEYSKEKYMSFDENPYIRLTAPRRDTAREKLVKQLKHFSRDWEDVSFYA
jgi:hypothetical protein